MFTLTNEDILGNKTKVSITYKNLYNEVQAKVNSIYGQNVSNETIYTVKNGDTLSEIAQKYNTTYQKIAKDNNIENPNLIYPNQKLVIK